MSTLALEGSEAAAERRLPAPLRYPDLVLLALALPVFVLAELPLAGYAVAAIAWIAQRAIELWATRRVAEDLAAGERRSALGVKAGSTLGRIWLVTAAVLAVGLFGEREDGLAAAVLSAILFTAYFAGEAARHVFGREAR